MAYYPKATPYNSGRARKKKKEEEQQPKQPAPAPEQPAPEAPEAPKPEAPKQETKSFDEMAAAANRRGYERTVTEYSKGVETEVVTPGELDIPERLEPQREQLEEANREGRLRGSGWAENDVSVDVSTIDSVRQLTFFGRTLNSDADRYAVAAKYAELNKLDLQDVLWQMDNTKMPDGAAAFDNPQSANGIMRKSGLYDYEGNEIDPSLSNPAVEAQAIRLIADEEDWENACYAYSNKYGYIDFDELAFMDSADLTKSGWNKAAGMFEAAFSFSDGETQANQDAYLALVDDIVNGNLDVDGVNTQNPRVQKQLLSKLAKEYQRRTGIIPPTLDQINAAREAQAQSDEAQAQSGGEPGGSGDWKGALDWIEKTFIDPFRPPEDESEPTEEPGSAGYVSGGGSGGASSGSYGAMAQSNEAGEIARAAEEAAKRAAAREETAMTAPQAGEEQAQEEQAAQEDGEERGSGEVQGPAYVPGTAKTGPTIDQQIAAGAAQAGKTPQQSIATTVEYDPDMTDAQALDYYMSGVQPDERNLKQIEWALKNENAMGILFGRTNAKNARAYKMNQDSGGIAPASSYAAINSGGNINTESEILGDYSYYGREIGKAMNAVSAAPGEIAQSGRLEIAQIVDTIDHQGHIPPNGQNLYDYALGLEQNSGLLAEVRSVQGVAKQVADAYAEAALEQKQAEITARENAVNRILSGNGTEGDAMLIAGTTPREDVNLWDDQTYAAMRMQMEKSGDYYKAGGTFWQGGSAAAAEGNAISQLSGTDGKAFKSYSTTLQKKTNELLDSFTRAAYGIGVSLDKYLSSCGIEGVGDVIDIAHTQLVLEGRALGADAQAEQAINEATTMKDSAAILYGLGGGALDILSDTVQGAGMSVEDMIDAQIKQEAKLEYFGAYGENAPHQRRLDLIEYANSDAVSEETRNDLLNQIESAHDIFDIAIDLDPGFAMNLVRTTHEELGKTAEALQGVAQTLPEDQRWLFNTAYGAGYNVGMIAESVVTSAITRKPAFGTMLGVGLPSYTNFYEENRAAGMGPDMARSAAKVEAGVIAALNMGGTNTQMDLLFGDSAYQGLKAAANKGKTQFFAQLVKTFGKTGMQEGVEEVEELLVSTGFDLMDRELIALENGAGLSLARPIQTMASTLRETDHTALFNEAVANFGAGAAYGMIFSVPGTLRTAHGAKKGAAMRQQYTSIDLSERLVNGEVDFTEENAGKVIAAIQADIQDPKFVRWIDSSNLAAVDQKASIIAMERGTGNAKRIEALAQAEQAKTYKDKHSTALEAGKKATQRWFELRNRVSNGETDLIAEMDSARTQMGKDATAIREARIAEEKATERARNSMAEWLTECRRAAPGIRSEIIRDHVNKVANARLQQAEALAAKYESEQNIRDQIHAAIRKMGDNLSFEEYKKTVAEVVRLTAQLEGSAWESEVRSRDELLAALNKARASVSGGSSMASLTGAEADILNAESVAYVEEAAKILSEMYDEAATAEPVNESEAESRYVAMDDAEIDAEIDSILAAREDAAEGWMDADAGEVSDTLADADRRRDEMLAFLHADMRETVSAMHRSLEDGYKDGYLEYASEATKIQQRITALNEGRRRTEADAAQEAEAGVSEGRAYAEAAVFGDGEAEAETASETAAPKSEFDGMTDEQIDAEIERLNEADADARAQAESIDAEREVMGWDDELVAEMKEESAAPPRERRQALIDYEIERLNAIDRQMAQLSEIDALEEELVDELYAEIERINGQLKALGADVEEITYNRYGTTRAEVERAARAQAEADALAEVEADAQAEAAKLEQEAENLGQQYNQTSADTEALAPVRAELGKKIYVPEEIRADLLTAFGADTLTEVNSQHKLKLTKKKGAGTTTLDKAWLSRVGAEAGGDVANAFAQVVERNEANLEQQKANREAEAELRRKRTEADERRKARVQEVLNQRDNELNYLKSDANTLPQPTKKNENKGTAKSPRTIAETLIDALGIKNYRGMRNLVDPANLKRLPKEIVSFYSNQLDAIFGRSKETGAVIAAFHEIGHAIDKRMNLTATQDMIDHIPGTFKQNYSASEIPAEAKAYFYTLYTIMPDAAEAYAGDAFVREFEREAKRLGIDKAISEAREDMLYFISQGTEGRLAAVITTPAEESGGWLRKLMRTLSPTSLLDETLPLTRVEAVIREKTGNSGVPAWMNPRAAARMRQTSSLRSQRFFDNAVTDANWKIVAKGLSDRVGNLNDKQVRKLSGYLIAQQALDRRNNGKQLLDEYVFDNKRLEDYVADVMQNDKAVAEAAEGIYEWWNDVMENMMVNTGFINQKAWELLKKTYPHYVPTIPAQTARTKGGKKPGGTFSIKTAKGGVYDIIDPIISMRGMVDAMVLQTSTNNIGLAFESAYRQFPEAMAEFAVPVGQGLNELKALNSDEVREIIDKGGSQDDVMTEVFRQMAEKAHFGNKGTSSESDVLTVQHADGTVTQYKFIDKEMFNAIVRGGDKSVKTLANAFGGLTRFISKMATTYKPSFTLMTNPWRDIPNSMNYGSWAYSWADAIPKWLSALYDVMRETDDVKQFKATGAGGLSLLESTSKKSIEEFKGSVFGSGARKLSAEKVADFASFQQFADWFETTSRYVEVKYGKTRVKGAEARAEEGIYTDINLVQRDVTTDFFGQGNTQIARDLNSLLPFFHAAENGVYRIVKMFADEGERSRLAPRLAKFTINTAIASVGAHMLRKAFLDDEEENDYVNYLSEDVKAKYWHLPNPFYGEGDGAMSNMRLIRIPIPQDFISYGVHGAVTNYFSKGEYDDLAISAEAILETMLMSMVPVNGTVFDVAIDIAANRTWYGSPIEPRMMTDYNPVSDANRYDEDTSGIAIFAGSLTGLSPMKIDYFMEQTFGDPWKTGRALVEKGPLGILESWEKAVTSDPLKSSDLSNKFYDAQEWLKEIVNDAESGKAVYGLKPGMTQDEVNKAVRAAEDLLDHEMDEGYEALREMYADIEEIDSNENLTTAQKNALMRDARRKGFRAVNEVLGVVESFQSEYGAYGRLLKNYKPATDNGRK